ncbi:MAG: carbohydrate ABC transporter permease [Tepidisphaeraceae bacterium]
MSVPALREVRSNLWTFQSRGAPYLFVLPFCALFCVFMLYPLARSVSLSLHRTIGPRHEVFVGLANYRFLLGDPYFWLSVANTVAFAGAFLAIQVPLSLGLALLLNHESIRMRNMLRFAFFSTSLVGQAFVAVMFSQILATRGGLLNQLLEKLSGREVEIRWLSDPPLALVSVLIAALWLSVGYAMVYFLAALQAVDRELYEQAQVDGAGRFGRFWHVTLPSIRPVLAFVVVVGTIFSLQLFELPYVLFQQEYGPNHRAMTVVMYLFLTGFRLGDLGYASAIGWALAMMIMLLTLAQARLTRATRDI